MGEGVAQSPGEPVVGIRIRDAEHRPLLQESPPCRLPVGPCRPIHRPEDPLVVFWGRPTLQGHLLVPPVPPEEHGIEGLVPQPPWWSPSRLSSATRTPPSPGGGPHPPGGLGPCPSPGLRAGPPLPPAPSPPAAPVPAARAPRPAPPPPRQWPSAPAPPSARGGGSLVLGSGGFGGDEVSGVGVDVVEVGVVVVMVVGLVRQDLFNAEGDAPHRLHVQLWERPAPRPPPFARPSPRGSCAPSSLSPGAHGALALALESLPGSDAFVPMSAQRSRPVHCPHRRSRMRTVEKSRSHCVVSSACFIIKHYRLF